MAQEEGTFTTKFNQETEYRPHWMDDPEYDLVEDTAEGGWGPIIVLALLLVIGGLVWVFWPSIRGHLPERLQPKQVAVVQQTQSSPTPQPAHYRQLQGVVKDTKPLDLQCPKSCRFHLSEVKKGVQWNLTVEE